MSTLYIMMGLPGLGKSTYAREQIMKKDGQAVVISSDELRATLLNDIDRQNDNTFVFSMMYHMSLAALQNGKNVIYDATCLQEGKRRLLVERLKGDVKGLDKIIGVYFTGTVEDAIQRNALRSRCVPSEVIKRLSKQFDIPTLRDNYLDEIQYYTIAPSNHSGLERMLGSEDYTEFTNRMRNNIMPYFNNVDLPQDCPYHTLSVSRHIYEAFKYGQINIPERLIGWRTHILYALAFHDIGKYVCKEFRKDSKYAHFTGHEKVSAQMFTAVAATHDCLSESETIDTAFIAALIKEHGFPYKDKDIFKYENALAEIEVIYGQEFRDCLEFVRECDQAAH